MDRKHHRPLTPADLVRRRRPDLREPDEPEADYGPSFSAAVAEPEPHPFFTDDERERFRARWLEVQSGFVDEPRYAVEQADGLVTQVIDRLADVFADERAGLEGQWAIGGAPSTEDLRLSLQRYRAFFDRLLGV